MKKRKITKGLIANFVFFGMIGGSLLWVFVMATWHFIQAEGFFTAVGTIALVGAVAWAFLWSAKHLNDDYKDEIDDER